MSDDPHPRPMPWDIDTAHAMQDHGLPIREARDLVILDWLSRGDAKPFYDLFLCGHQPGAPVLEALAIMLMRGDPDCDFHPALTKNPGLAAHLPFALVVKDETPKPGRKAWSSKPTRDRQIAEAVAAYMANGNKYELAVCDVRDDLAKIGIHVSVQTVRDAYDSWVKLYGR